MKIEKPAAYVAAGAGLALVAAMAVPASVLLGLGAATAGGLYLYRSFKDDPARGKPDGGCGDGKPGKGEGGKEGEYVDV